MTIRIFSYSIGPLRLILLTATLGFLAYGTYENWPKPPAPPAAPPVLTQAERANMESLVAPTLGANLAVNELAARNREQARQSGRLMLTPEARRAAEQELADPVRKSVPKLVTGTTPPAPELTLGNRTDPSK